MSKKDKIDKYTALLMMGSPISPIINGNKNDLLKNAPYIQQQYIQLNPTKYSYSRTGAKSWLLAIATEF